MRLLAGAAMMGAALAGAAAQAEVTWWAVPAMSGEQRIPDKDPTDGEKGGTVRIVAAKEEYEPGSFVLLSDADLGKVEINADPKFVDADACDYRLVETPRAERSPCVDAGLYAPWMKTATDLDGKARVKHVFPSGKARVDIGCYESAYWPVGLMLMVK